MEKHVLLAKSGEGSEQTRQGETFSHYDAYGFQVCSDSQAISKSQIGEFHWKQLE